MTERDVLRESRIPPPARQWGPRTLPFARGWSGTRFVKTLSEEARVSELYRPSSVFRLRQRNESTYDLILLGKALLLSTLLSTVARQPPLCVLPASPKVLPVYLLGDAGNIRQLLGTQDVVWSLSWEH